MSLKKSKLFLTGASGLLGRAIQSKFVSEGWDVYGIALTRASGAVHKLDITNESDVVKAIAEFAPDIVIHAAAQRFPDKVEADPEAARKINVEATSHIVKAAGERQIPVIYISTDYVFDGNSHKPYTVNDTPNPINLYGKTKLEGEIITLKHTDNLVLRVPVLYGPVESLKESAVTCLLEPLLKSSANVKVSDVERRCPSHVNDIALICLQLSTAALKDRTVNGIFQWCGKEKMTKYQMVLKMAEIFELPSSHIAPEVTSASNTKRPYDTELDRSRVENLAFGQHTQFEKGIFSVLNKWVPPKQK